MGRLWDVFRCSNHALQHFSLRRESFSKQLRLGLARETKLLIADSGRFTRFTGNSVVHDRFTTVRGTGRKVEYFADLSFSTRIDSRVTKPFRSVVFPIGKNLSVQTLFFFSGATPFQVFSLEYKIVFGHLDQV